MRTKSQSHKIASNGVVWKHRIVRRQEDSRGIGSAAGNASVSAMQAACVKVKWTGATEAVSIVAVF